MCALVGFWRRHYLCGRRVSFLFVAGVGLASPCLDSFYGVGLGFFFGVASGAATGVTVALEQHRTSGGQGHYSLPWEALFSAIRGFAFGAGLYRVAGLQFAVAFAILITGGQVFAYSRGM